MTAMNNADIWDKFSKTDPSQTKAFSRSGGFKGTAVKPIYCSRRMTEMFGPYGKGWGCDKPDYQLVPGENRELLVYCTLNLWWMDGSNRHESYGVGGDKVITYIKASQQYSRSERWENDDEAFKKAFTDAMTNAMKNMGMSADIHMGLFDDSKYVNDLRREFAEDGEAQQPKAPATQTTADQKPMRTTKDVPARQDAPTHTSVSTPRMKPVQEKPVETKPTSEFDYRAETQYVKTQLMTASSSDLVDMILDDPLVGKIREASSAAYDFLLRTADQKRADLEKVAA